MSVGAIVEGALCIALGGFVIRGGFRKFEENRLIADTPTSKTRSAAVGFVELKGKAKGKTVTAPLSKKECLYYRYVEYQLRWVGSGKSRHLEWVQTKEEEKGDSFMLEDDTGSLKVELEGVPREELDIRPRMTCNQRTGQPGLIARMFGKKQPENSQPVQVKPGDMSTFGYIPGDKKFAEYSIQPEDSIYVLGTLDVDGVVSQGKEEKEFLISDKSEAEMLKSTKRQSWIFNSIGAGLVLFGVVLLLSATVPLW